MIFEGRGISNVVKDAVNVIWNLYKTNSYSEHTLRLNDYVYDIVFILKNNYYSNLIIDKNKKCIISFGIPPNGKEQRVKEVISHELTHLIEVIGLDKKEYPKYWNIKKSILSYKPKSKTAELLIHCIYKTLDNEINANVAQTYVYLDGFGYLSKVEYRNKLMEYSEWIEYNNILNIDKNIIKSKLNFDEITELNDILIANKAKTIKTSNLDSWIDYWFNIFKRKASLYIKKSNRIIDEVYDKYKHFEVYTTIPNDSSKVMDYTEYLKHGKQDNNKDI